MQVGCPSAVLPVPWPTLESGTAILGGSASGCTGGLALPFSPRLHDVWVASWFPSAMRRRAGNRGGGDDRAGGGDAGAPGAHAAARQCVCRLLHVPVHAVAGLHRTLQQRHRAGRLGASAGGGGARRSALLAAGVDCLPAVQTAASGVSAAAVLVAGLRRGWQPSKTDVPDRRRWRCWRGGCAGASTLLACSRLSAAAPPRWK